MSRIKNKKIYDIALQVGGSHYPDVGGELLEKFGEMIIKECAELAEKESSYPYKSYSEMIKEHFGVK